MFGLLAFILVGVRGGRAVEFSSTDAVFWNDRIVVLKADGTFAVWKMPAGDADKQTESGLRLNGVLHLACDRSRLWAATGTVLFSRDSAVNSWSKIAMSSERDLPMLALLTVGESPLLVYQSVVVDPISQKEFPVPKSEGQIQTNVLRLLASYGTEKMAWFGTGHGEWGGNLIGLDPSTGTWVQEADALHYVTGITSASANQVLVSWSMSHMMADTRIRRHDSAAKSIQEWPELQQKYYQRIAYSRNDRALYGIENESLVRIVEGRPIEIVKLPGKLFSPERHAIGVAPGIRALIPVAPSVVVVVPNVGSLLRVDVANRIVIPLE